MIKKLTLTIITTLFSVAIFAQNFDFLLNKNNENNNYDIIETSDGYISVGYELQNQIYYPFILKLDKFGQVLLDSVDYTQYNFDFSSIQQNNNSILLTKGKRYKNNSPKDTLFKVSLLSIDSTLKIINNNIYIKDTAKKLFLYNTRILEDSLMFVFFQVEDSALNRNSAATIINLNSGQQDYIYLGSPNRFFEGVSDVLKMNNKYYFFTYFGANPTSICNSNTQIKVLNMNLTLDTVVEICYTPAITTNFGFNISALKLNDDKFMMVSRANNSKVLIPTAPNDLAALIWDTNYSQISVNFYGKLDSNAKEAIGSASRNKNDNNIYIGGTENSQASSPYPIDTSFYMLTKIDLNGNEIWTRYYSNNTYLFMNKVLATTDGGAIMIGTSYNQYSPNGQEKDIYILKVDSNGNYTPTGLKDNKIAKDNFIFYPNPIENQLHFRQINVQKNYTLEIFNINGQKVIEQAISNSDAYIDVSNLNSGTYIYHLTDEKGNFASDKLIKK